MKIKTVIMLIFIATSIPIIVALLLEFSLFWKVETENDWIGFYASYVGSIIGVLGVFEVMRIDQRRREEERKDELFLNNLTMYSKIVSSLQVKKLSKLKERLAEIRSENNWSMVDTSTRKILKQIESNLDYSDEVRGLFYTVREYIRANLHHELKVILINREDEFNESVKYEDVPNEVLDEITNIIINNSDVELFYKNSVEIIVPKEILLGMFEENNYTKGYGNKIDFIYTKLTQIRESKEWSDYISKRIAIFSQIKDLISQINSRTEKVLNY